MKNVSKILFCLAILGASALAESIPSVKIGNQVWMKKNLNIKTPDSWCYENKPENCKKYGRLYSWGDAQKVCPAGWHLPSDKEWSALLETAGGFRSAGEMLKAKTDWSDGNNGNDSFGFSVLPAEFSNRSDSRGKADYLEAYIKNEICQSQMVNRHLAYLLL